MTNSRSRRSQRLNRASQDRSAPNRAQIELRPSDLESLLPEGHRARMVWGFVTGQDLQALYAGIKSVEGGVTAIAYAFVVAPSKKSFTANYRAELLGIEILRGG